MMLSTLNDNFMLGYVVKPEVIDGKIKINFNLCKLNSKTEIVKTIIKKSVDYDPSKPLNPLDFVTHFAVGHDEFYIAEKSSNSFQIKTYNFKGEELYRIKKDYRKIAYSKEELMKLNKAMNSAMKSVGVQESGVLEVKTKYKEAINGMFVDKLGRLWVDTAKNEENISKKFTYDVFEKGVFLKTVTLAIKQSSDIEGMTFLEDKLLLTDYENNTVKVFMY